MEKSNSYLEEIEAAAKEATIKEGILAGPNYEVAVRTFKAGVKWMASRMPMPEDTVIFMKGVAEGRRLEREDRNDDKLPRLTKDYYYGG